MHRDGQHRLEGWASAKALFDHSHRQQPAQPTSRKRAETMARSSRKPRGHAEGFVES
jgi:hypothetical protein